MTTMARFGVWLLLGALARQQAAPASSAEKAKGQPGRVTLSDIESNLRSLGGSAASTVGKSAPTMAAAAAVGGAALLAGVYLYGRRRGRRRATVLEIRRV